MRSSRWLGLVGLIALAVRHAAGDPTPDRAVLRDQAAKLATGATNTAAFVACGQAYLDIYNRDPQQADNDEVLYNGAVCYQEGRSISAALVMFNLLAKYYPSSKLAAKATMRLARAYGDIAFYDRASDKYEDYARKYPAEKDAFEAISDAMFFRRAIGDDDKAIDDTRYFIKTFGASRPKEAAAAMFSLTSIYEKRGDDAVIKHLRDYLAQFGPSGGADRLVIAHAKIGHALWRQSCPVKAVDGLCAKVTREHASALRLAKKKPAELPTQCGSAAKLVIAVVPRDEHKVRDAMASFTAAAAEYEKRQGKTGGDERAARYSYAQAMLAESDELLEKHLALGFPVGLDFDPVSKALRDKSIKRFADWITAKNKTGDTATAKYQSVLAIKDPASSIAAMARLGQLAQSFAATLHDVQIPQSLRTGEFAADKVAAFCDQMTEVAEPLEKRAIEAFTICLSKSVDLSWVDESTRSCERELGQLDPATHVTLVELHAAPTKSDLEADVEPPDTDTAAIAHEDQAFAARDKTAWTEAACRSSAAQFAKHPDLADAQYMVGLSLQRCNLSADAEKAYQQALATAPSHGRSLSNLGTIYFRAGKLDAARQYWDSALKANGRLIAARTNLATLELDQLHKLAPTDPAWKKLEEDARFQLSNVLGVDGNSARAYTLLALLYLEGAPRNQNRLELAKVLLDAGVQRNDKLAALHNAYGLYFIRRDESASALQELTAAASADPQLLAPHLNAGLLLVSIRAFDKARAELSNAALATSYDAQVGLGIAQRGLGDAAAAEAAYKRAIALDASRGDAHYDLGVLYKEVRANHESDLASARSDLQRARDEFTAFVARTTNPGLQADARSLVADCDAAIATITASLQSQPSP